MICFQQTFLLKLQVDAEREGTRTRICAVVDACSVFAGQEFGVEAGVARDGKHVFNLSEHLNFRGLDFVEQF